MTFEEAEDYLSGLGRFGWKLNLERIEALCAEFGHPERKFRSVHVGGSNGKGSTATMIASILQASGHRTSLYLSPYVHCVRERVQVNGDMIPESAFARLMTQLQPVVDRIASESEIGQPTEFEVKTILGFLYFAEQECEFAVVEVGLGGRFDATNVLYPEVSVITNVTLDHMERLGNTVAEIAGEKAGIVKHEIPCVTGATGDAEKVIAQQCHDMESMIWRLGHEVIVEHGSGDRFSVQVGQHHYTDLRIHLRGEHQVGNAALAVAAVDQLIREHVPITDSAIREGLENAYIPGRFEVLHRSPTLITDGAHNPAKAEALARTLEAEYPGQTFTFILGAVRGHDVEASLGQLLPLARKVIATQPDSERALPATEIAEIVQRHEKEAIVIPSVPEAVAAALNEADPEEIIVVTGSFYVIGEVPRNLHVAANSGVPA